MIEPRVFRCRPAVLRARVVEAKSRRISQQNRNGTFGLSRRTCACWAPAGHTDSAKSRGFPASQLWHRRCHAARRMDTTHPDATQLVPTLERALDDVPTAAIAVLIGDLERLQAVLTARLVRETLQTAPGPRSTGSLDDLQHLTPQQVGEILNLKAAYVHELCRTGRIPAMKSGKYWMIPVAALRQWVYQKGDVDGSARLPLESRDARADVAATRLTGPAGRPRRSPMT